jgi:7-cyano-7-deazaguanine synthase
MREVLLLASGGLDSTTVAYWLRQNGLIVSPVFFDYGQHCAEKEWNTLLEVLPKDGVRPPQKRDVSDIFRGSKSRLVREADLWTEDVTVEELYIPYRTLFFFAASAAIAQTMDLTDVYSGFINSNHAKEIDCSSTFLNDLGALAQNVGPVRFHIPFRDKSKKEVATIAQELAVPIGRTFSCQVFSDIPCGACPNCVDRISALNELELQK